ncbi:hypothetical protein RCC94_07095 [Exiguobacterium acetylicum]|jgi:hypothetical protein|uniref:hypothetical protein n=1 Tax=Exiguobacterium TaxID=33986 RepID=UPI00044B68BE|nr:MULTISPECIES: hypothetical protein [Exiguobacterium]EZP60722.1 hypothetical protein BW42_00391 [Exiguobacterium sp. RIT341]KQS40216.1 hypothetical protein ASG02_07315 [Exiguobacterium sp. Leaf196]MDQ6467247.1 hypothetical protein [Exiguobacterium acetylicum]
MTYEDYMQGDVIVSVQAIEELLACTIEDYGVRHYRIKRMDWEEIAFSVKVDVSATSLHALYQHVRQQLKIQLGDDVVSYVQFVTR